MLWVLGTTLLTVSQSHPHLQQSVWVGVGLCAEPPRCFSGQPQTIIEIQIFSLQGASRTCVSSSGVSFVSSLHRICPCRVLSSLTGSGSPQFSLAQFSSVTQSCPTFCSPWTAVCQASLSITISQSLLKFISIESVMPSSHLILCCVFSSCLQSFPASGSFPMSRLFSSGGQSIGVSASEAVLPMNNQG